MAVHRIGRTARAGALGIAYSFCDAEEGKYLRDIEKLTRQKIEVVDNHPFAGVVSAPIAVKAQPQQQKKDSSSKSRKRNYWRNRNKQKS